MSEEREGLRKIGAFFLYSAGAVFVLSFIMCILIQGLSLPLPEVFGFIAYFGGPLPLIPAVLGTIGVVLIGVSRLMK